MAIPKHIAKVFHARLGVYKVCNDTVTNIVASIRDGTTTYHPPSRVEKCIQFCNDLLERQLEVEAMQNWLTILRGYQQRMQARQPPSRRHSFSSESSFARRQSSLRRPCSARRQS